MSELSKALAEALMTAPATPYRELELISDQALAQYADMVNATMPRPGCELASIVGCPTSVAAMCGYGASGFFSWLTRDEQRALNAMVARIRQKWEEEWGKEQARPMNRVISHAIQRGLV